MTRPPQSERDLSDRARQLAGMTLQQVAMAAGLSLPTVPKNAKGWIGTLAESWLGATAGSLSEPDFQYIGVELKTLPLGINGSPCESTYVCAVPLVNTIGLTWENSTVKRKLARVLWLPVESASSIPFAERRFGSTLLWSPDAQQETLLKNDWEELMEMVITGRLELISSHHGRALQIRPKAANARALGRAYNEEGIPATTLPRGFYLRTSFTKNILQGG